MPNENSQEFAYLLDKIANGDKDALLVCRLWTTYCHKFDDLVDSDVPLTADNMVECNNVLTRMLTNSFFVQYKDLLMLNLIMVGEAYAAAENMKVMPGVKEQEWAAYLRHSGNDFLRLIALLTGGEKHLANMSRKLRELSIKDHYTKETHQPI